jgi:hypothetical protein
MKKLLFILPLLYYSCTDDIVTDIGSLQTENQELESYLDSLNTAQQIADSLNNLAIQAYIDSLINAGNIADDLLQTYIDSLNNVQSNDDIEQQAYIDSLINAGNIADDLLQTYIDSLNTIQNFDCNGELFGSAIIDDCGMCTGGTTGLVANYLMDCAGICGGNAIESSCGICSDFNSHDFSEITNYDFSILNSVCDYNDQYVSTNNDLLTNLNSAFIFIEGSENNRILISIPHAQRSFRYKIDDPDNDDDEHSSEYFTGAYGKILSEITGAALITSKYKSDDANYYDSIPPHTQTPAFENMIGQKLPYKAKLDALLNQDLGNIFLIIDIHGKTSSAFQSRWAIDVGVGESYQSLTTEIGQCIPDIFSSIFLKYGFNSTYNSIHDGYGSQRTITTYVTDEINLNLDAMQLEINYEFRGCDGEEWEDYYNMIMALSEFINTMNYIYNSEIISQ